MALHRRARSISCH